jgi:hypothetical protein
MGTVHRLFENKSFDPETVKAMGLAFDAAWQRLLEAGTSLASSGYAEVTREAIALHIIDAVHRGQRDVAKLQEDAVAFVLRAMKASPQSN